MSSRKLIIGLMCATEILDGPGDLKISLFCRRLLGILIRLPKGLGRKSVSNSVKALATKSISEMQ